MFFEAYSDALDDAFDLESLKEARREVAVALATGAKNLIEINLRRVDGRETSGIVLTTFQERMAFLAAAKTLIDRAEGRSGANSGIKTDFSRVPVDP